MARRPPPAALERLLAALGDEGRLRRRCGRVGDWDRLFDRAFEHGVAALLAHRLSELEVTLPQPAADRLARRLAVDRLWHRRVAAALDAALRALAERSVRVVVLKGVLLGERLYPAAHLRHTLDVDLMVAPADLETARSALAEIGYRSADADPCSGTAFHHHIELRSASGPVLDLHYRASYGVSVALPAGELVARANPRRTAGGAAAWVLQPEDELLYLAVHAARHRLERLGSLYDLKLLLDREADLDWALVGDRARSYAVRHAVALALRAAERRLALALPEGAGRAGLPDDLRLRLAALLAAAGRSPFRFAGGRQLYQALLADRPVAAARGWLRRRAGVWRHRRRGRRGIPPATLRETVVVSEGLPSEP